MSGFSYLLEDEFDILAKNREKFVLFWLLNVLLFYRSKNNYRFTLKKHRVTT